ncbi:hypothetical protein NPIL_232771 [Nephila pilipes]|uniref:Uncharacterized protein n=1 Tax=Nephila pilipes TaxID=299642 RepID=A0A8X6Q2J7_NEPPI|nr:hypothetical protein NPIL_232771 [Nephila pilipes]
MLPQKQKSDGSNPDLNFKKVVAHSSLKLSFPREQMNDLFKNTQTDTKISVWKGEESKGKLEYLKIKKFVGLCNGKHLLTRNFSLNRGGEPQLRIHIDWREGTDHLTS